MKYIHNKLICIIFGLFLYALGVVLTINAALGLAPWEVFHQSLSDLLALSFGTVSISVGLIICLVDWLLGEKLGLGTLLNIVLIGVFIDLLQYFNFLPHPASLVGRLILLLLGLFVIGVACYFYISVGWGAGPRDSLMVVLARKTGYPVGPCRIVIEGTVLLVGWMLGGPVGMGTVVAVLGGGIMVQLAFAIFRFDATQVAHEPMEVTFRSWRRSVPDRED